MLSKRFSLACLFLFFFTFFEPLLLANDSPSCKKILTLFHVVRWRDGAYRSERWPHRIVPTQKVEKLIEIAKRRPEKRGLLPISRNWTSQNINIAIEEYEKKQSPQKLSKKQKSILSEAFKDYWKTLQSPSIYTPSADECRSTCKRKVIVHTKEGELIHISSLNLHPTYLPWKVHSGGDGKTTYNDDLTNAISDCFDLSFGNENDADRILRQTIINDLIHNEVHLPFHKAKLAKRFRDALSNSNTDFVAEHVRVKMRYGQGPLKKFTQPLFIVTLRNYRLPPNYKLELIFKTEDFTFEKIIEKADQRVEQVSKKKKFLSLLRSHPKHRFRNQLMWFHNLKEQFIYDYTRNNRPKHEALAHKVYKDSSLLEIVESGNIQTTSTWLLLSDDRLVLWHHYGKNILNHEAKVYAHNRKIVTAKIVPWKELGIVPRNWFGLTNSSW